MQERQLWFETFIQALDEDIRALGGRKAVALLLRPELETKPIDAHNWINDCLNPERRQRFSDEQIRAIIRRAREAKSFAAINFWCEDCGFDKPKPLNPADEAGELQRRIETNLGELRGLVQRLERLGQSPIQVVKTA